eukprot:GGOE01014095.1.p1 GENE.GGOE01014095.1~~GGOE01014095.1.p1  ORF type:complete len:799 (+),score=261.25 GGOE01014095.1:48-2444(+)
MEQLVEFDDILTGVETAAQEKRKRKQAALQQVRLSKRQKTVHGEASAGKLKRARKAVKPTVEPDTTVASGGDLPRRGRRKLRVKAKQPRAASSEDSGDESDEEVEQVFRDMGAMEEEEEFDGLGLDEEEMDHSAEQLVKRKKLPKDPKGGAGGSVVQEAQGPQVVSPGEEWDWKKAHIHEDLLKGLVEMGITKPTPIQRAMLRPALEGACILAAAQTGSGKTLAFGVPVLQRILLDIARGGDNPQRRLLSCLVLTPTRELAMQIKEHLSQAAKLTPIKVVPIVGGMSEQKQTRLLVKGRPHIVVATPGRLNKLLTEDNIPFVHQSLSLQLKFLVIDEGDRMLEMHHFDDLDGILKQLSAAPADKSWGEIDSMKGILKDGEVAKGKAAKQVRTFTSCFEEFKSIDEFLDSNKSQKKTEISYMLPSLEGEAAEAMRKQRTKRRRNVQRLARRQIFIMSATMTLATRWKDGTKKIRKWNPENPDDAYMHALVSRVGLPLKAFKLIDVNPEHQTAETLKEMKVDCTVHDRDYYLYYFLTMYPGRTIIFVNAVSAVRRLAAILKVLQLPCYPLHAQMEQQQRLKYFDRFKEDDKAIVVCTDVLGRGTDVHNVKYVVHYQFPRNTEIYMHRCGRTARAFKPGLTVALLTPLDAINYRQVCVSLGYKKGLEDFPVDTNVFIDIKPRVQLALSIDQLLNEKNKKKSELAWYKKAANDLDIDLDEDLVANYEVDPHERKIRDKKVRFMQSQLRRLLAVPLTSMKGAYMSSAANLVRKQLHAAALAHRVEFSAEEADADDTDAQERAG